MLGLKLWGGLGNQMFIYALYKKLKLMNRDIRIDDSDLVKSGNQHNGEELRRVFGLDFETLSAKDKEKIIGRSFYKRINRKILRTIGSEWGDERVIFDKENFDYTIYGLDNRYLVGYWQSWKYFFDIKDDLFEDFTFIGWENDKNKRIIDEIINSNSVSIHVRRGDYLTDDNINVLGNVCSQAYYRKCINYINDRIDSPRFFIFSNDIQWCIDNFNNSENMIFVDWNTGNMDFCDMFLMSYCKHSIIANSTFSWWGAYLNRNKNKIICSPEKWVNKKEALEDIICDDWERIKGE